jgi:hypothetical protein
LVDTAGQLTDSRCQIQADSAMFNVNFVQFYADNLGPEQHQLVLSADQTPSTGQFMDVDAVTIFSSAGGNSSNGANNASPSFVLRASNIT